MIKTNLLSVKDIAGIAKRIRTDYNIKEDEAFPILDYLNYLYDNELVGIIILDDNDPYLDKNTPAVYNAVDNFIYLKESVIVEVVSGNYRSNFTLAHELFHYLQYQIFKFTFEKVEDRKTYEDPEWQANEFAGELLVPKIYLDLDDEYLMTHFKVSMECVLTRKVKILKRKNR